MKKILVVMIIATLCMGFLFSCAEETAPPPQAQEDTGNGDNGGDDDGTAAVDPTVERITHNLPEGRYFDGYVFTVLSHREDSLDWYSPYPREIIAEEEDGRPINDAVFRRNATLRENYGFYFDLVAVPDSVGRLRMAIAAGEDRYGAIIIFNNHVSNAVQAGILIDVDHLTYVDRSMPWWCDGVEAMSIMNRNFLLASDMLILDNEATNALIFNKVLMDNLGLPFPYDLVTSGRWTFDAMESMMRQATQDLDGDGVMTPEHDRWGFVTYNDTLHALLVAGGGSFAEKDDNDVPFMVFADERNLRIGDRAMDIMLSDDTMNIQRDVPSGGDGNPGWQRVMYDVFTEDRALFMWVRMRVIERFRGMESGFGILPLPKFDEHQDNYRSIVNPWTGVLMGVPLSATDLDRTSFILEAAAAESRYTLQVAYYDIVLQRQFARDNESEAMLDLIFSTRTYDIGAVYNFGGIFGEYIGLAANNNRNIISFYERMSRVLTREIERTIDRLMDLD